MKKFTKGCLTTALILFILGCIICSVCGLLGGFRQIRSGALNGIANIPFRYYRGADGNYGFGFLDTSWEEEDFWENGDWQQTDVDGTKQKLAVTGDSLRNLNIEVTKCDLRIEESSDAHAWLAVSGDTGKTYYTIEEDMANKDTLSVCNSVYHRVGNWREGPNDTITLYLPGDCELDSLSIDMGVGYMEAVPLRAETMDINIGAGVCEGKRFEAETINVILGAGQIKIVELKADTATTEIGTGEIIVQDMDVKDCMEVELNMGNGEFTGTVTGQISAECNMGDLNFDLTGSEDDYRFRVDCDMGDVKIGSHHYSGFGDSRSWNDDKENLFEIDCDLGNVKVIFDN